MAAARVFADIAVRNARYGALLGFTPAAAARAAAEVAGRSRAGGRLSGAAVVVKDNIHCDGYPTHAGVGLALAGTEGGLLQRLRAAGCIVLAKAACTEMAYYAPGGIGPNPWHPAHTPGGSSAGSAAAVALGFAPLAVGTQTNGSVTRPAAYCGVYGLKPSTGRVPRDGVVPFAPTADQPGAFAASLRDLHAFGAAAVSDWDPALATADGHALRFGLAHDAYHMLSASGEAVKAVARAMHAATPTDVMSDIASVAAAHRVLTEGEVAREHAALVREHPDAFSLVFHEVVRRGGALSGDALEAARRSTVATRADVEALMDAAGVDVLITPATIEGAAPRAACGHTGDPGMSVPWSHSGHPTLAVPLGGRSAEGLPQHAVQLVARFGRDEMLLPAAQRLRAACSLGLDVALAV